MASYPPSDVAPVFVELTDAWIFDLDGVLTDTARLHQQAWAELFSEVFADEARASPPPRAFTEEDYLRLVDGEPRTDGVRHVLADRGISIPEGTLEDAADERTVYGLAKRKDVRYLALLQQEGPRPFASSVRLLERLRACGIDIGVVSASRHGEAVLDAAGLTPLVDVRIDGTIAQVMDLAGKPDPATFLEAARRLGVEPGRAAVVEDALAGVRAGRAGGFAVVIGVDRSGRGEELRRSGADVVVPDLGRLDLHGEGRSPWRHVFDDPSAETEGAVESVCTLANGYIGVRGARCWSRDDGVSYPGVYLAGVYNRLWSSIAGETIELESIVNQPNCLGLSIRTEGGPWLGDPGVSVLRHRLRLDVRSGTLTRRCLVEDSLGRRTALVERRIVSMASPHLVALELQCMPLNWSGRLEIRSALDSDVVDGETEEDRLLAHRHLALVDQGANPAGEVWLRVRTVQSGVTVAMAARHDVRAGGGSERWTEQGAPGSPDVIAGADVDAGGRVTVEKVVAVFTSKDVAISEPGEAARIAAAEASGFDVLLRAHADAWARLWARAAVQVDDPDCSAVRLHLHLFHLLQVASPHLVELDAGIGARGLHGEGYRGHVFWDTSFVFPALCRRFPAVAQAILAYRSRRLPQARRAAVATGRRGAQFPWQSGSDGREETPSILYNERSGRWMADRSRLQRHVGLAIGYEVWLNWQMTGDLDLLAGPGAELMVEIARFFADLATWDPVIGRFRIAGVMGPDEFHDGYPWSAEPGVTDNAYTNVMAAWLLWRAGDLVELLRAQGRQEMLDQLGVDDGEIDRWNEISRGLNIAFHDGVISQFDQYERLERIDLTEYRRRYGDIGGLDLILEAEGDSVRRYQVAKQADTLMLLYVFSAEELRAILARLGYELSPATIRNTVAHYAAQATHGSTLSRIVHAWVLARADRRASWTLFQEALTADLDLDRSRVTREGVHIGAMAGAVDLLERCYSGLEVRDDALWFHPLLPRELHQVRFPLTFRGVAVAVTIDHHHLRLEAAPGGLPRSPCTSRTRLSRSHPVAPSTCLCIRRNRTDEGSRAVGTNILGAMT